MVGQEDAEDRGTGTVLSSKILYQSHDAGGVVDSFHSSWLPRRELCWRDGREPASCVRGVPHLENAGSSSLQKLKVLRTLSPSLPCC